MIFIMITGIVLLAVLLCFFNGKLTERAIWSIYASVMYVLEIITCIVKHTVRTFSSNAVFSVILMVIFPMLLLFVGVFVATLIKQFKHNKSEGDTK